MSNITKQQKKFRKQIEDLENSLLESEDNRVAKGNSNMFPLKHYFVEGLYIREMFIKKNSFIIGKIHKQDHAWFLLKGKLLIITENEEKEIKAPFFSTSLAGTKKVGHALEDSIFINIHPNASNEKDINIIEENIVVKNYKVYGKFLISNNKNNKFKN